MGKKIEEEKITPEEPTFARMLLKATRSAKAVRDQHESKSETEHRNAFQIDADRITWSRAFRRLRSKTQAFTFTGHDHTRTRLTHTLEVASAARDYASMLSLNEDLAYAAALGHDLGHAPFGHLGEAVLNERLLALGGIGFHHAAHSVRIVESIEPLNLTRQVRDAMRSHSKGLSGAARKSERATIEKSLFSTPTTTPEALLVRIADVTAYLLHDLDDAQSRGLMNPVSLPASIRKLGDDHESRFRYMAHDLYTSSKAAECIRISPETCSIMDEFLEYMMSVAYHHDEKIRDEECYRSVVDSIFDACMTYGLRLGLTDPIRIADVVAGMTDEFALSTHEYIKENRGDLPVSVQAILEKYAAILKPGFLLQQD